MQSRRTFLAAAPIVLVAVATGRALATTPDTTPGSTPPTPGSGLPLDPASPILVIKEEGGFVPRGFDFAATPRLLITAGGDVYAGGAITADFPGPLLFPITVRTLTPAGIDMVLAAATTRRLLETPPDYNDVELQITDVPFTVVDITTAAGTVRHSAFALGFSPDGSGKEVTPERQRLRDFVDQVTDLGTLVGTELGPEKMFEPTEFRILATAVNPADWAGNDPQPVVKPWPAETGVKLAEAGTCARVPADKIGTLFADSSQLTFFTEGQATYQLNVRGVLPGDPDC